MKNSIFLSVVGLVVVLGMAGSVYAEGNTSTKKNVAKIETKCEVINKKIDAEVKNYTARKDLHIQTFTRMVERWTSLSARLKSKGYDTTILDKDLSTLGGMVSKLSSSYQEFVSNIEATKKADCETGIKDFRKNLLGSRTGLKQFKSQVDAIWKFIQNNIKKDLTSLKDQKVTIK